MKDIIKSSNQTWCFQGLFEKKRLCSMDKIYLIKDDIYNDSNGRKLCRSSNQHVSSADTDVKLSLVFNIASNIYIYSFVSCNVTFFINDAGHSKPTE